jgi:hypothetical protein
MATATLDWKPVTRTEDLEPLFRALADQWRAETAYHSFAHQYALHPAYQRIIGMGPAVVPLILEELRRAHGQWFWALRSITGVDPVPDEDKGDVRKSEAAWVAWGQRHGLIR